MAIDFPNSPTTGQIFTSGDKSWIWDGTVWKAYGASLSPTVLKVDSTNSRVGINNQSPTTALDVTGVTTSTSFAQGSDYLTPYTGFRNAIINGDFRINQRAWSSSTASGTYGFDRWYQSNVGGTVTMSSQSFTVGSPAATGYESANHLRMVTSSQSGNGDWAILYQAIENVRTFANSTVTVSFWAKAASGTPKIFVEMEQAFGSGGSPSAGVVISGGQVTLSTSWTRYTVTITVPNINGKTIGTTANTSAIYLGFWFSAGSNFNSRTGSLGLQSNTFDLWGVQVERGSVATPFEQRPIGTELALCQRYYQVIAVGTSKNLGNNVTLAANDTRGTFFLPVAMRIAASLTVTTGTGYYRYYYDATSVDSSSIGSYASGSETLIPYSSGAIIASGKSSMLVTNNASASVTASAEF